MPPEVLHEASKAVKNYKNTGLSILELPHRGKEFSDIVDESKELVRTLCGIDNSYEIVWLQGGGRLQFCMLPMNFLTTTDAAGYIVSGHWAEDAFECATHYGDAQILATSAPSKFDRLPEWPKEIPAQLKYVHITTNNTIYGTQWHRVPKIKTPLVADMSSDIFSCARDYSQYSMFYAAAQKNLGAAGVAMVAIKKDMLNSITGSLPAMLSYKAHVKENSVLNTPNVFGVYVSLLMLRWIRDKSIKAIEQENTRKAALLYSILDNSKVFTPYVKDKAHRSQMNVTFTAADAATEQKFLETCEKNDITGVKGHRSVGGFRVSLYNAIPYEAVEELTRVMREFEGL